ncbi:MAG: hypothetical protein CFH10_01810 [Alphaproteobacteria bacterium MarineAlpha4_Bin2]|nr:MAG: hypothetical protein CFH10_01810 [Alphaproteobacteria bacterium MarineAlpha4_Bin2]
MLRLDHCLASSILMQFSFVNWMVCFLAHFRMIVRADVIIQSMMARALGNTYKILELAPRMYSGKRITCFAFLHDDRYLLRECQPEA